MQWFGRTDEVGIKMIEFRGTFYQGVKSDPMTVLVQYDGVLLHIWHLSNPFHRLFSSDEFRILGSFVKAEKIIRFPNGGHLETDDHQAFECLTRKCKDTLRGTPYATKRNWVLALLGSMALALGACWLAKNGFLF